MVTILIIAFIVVLALAIIVGKGIKNAERPQPKDEPVKEDIPWGDIWP